MTEIAKHIPDIIKAAATSNLGIIALMLILLSALTFGFFRKSKLVWRFSALVVFLVGCMSFGYALFSTATYTALRDVGLSKAMDLWIVEAEKARAAKTISPDRPLPTSLVDTRNIFESTWKQSPLVEKRKQDAEKTYKALSYLNRIYRVVEHDSSKQLESNTWADEAIRHFEEMQNRKLLTGALLDKAAIYLDIVQLGNNDQRQFETIAREGDVVMTKAFQTAEPHQRPTVLRIQSRFYYNLARPKSFRLSDRWDNNYLLLAHEKAKSAYELASADSKNASQLARTAIKVSKNPPQDVDQKWTKELRDAQKTLKDAWLKNQGTLVGVDQRLSPLNVLGVATLETIAREWRELAPNNRKAKAEGYIQELDSDALSPLREAVAMLQNSELRKSYGFDINYDIARALAIKTSMLRTTSEDKASREFDEVKANLRVAKENAKTSQLESAVKDIGKEITFSLLSAKEQKLLLDTLSVVTAAGK